MKPLNRKNYGSIGHLPCSRMGPDFVWTTRSEKEAAVEVMWERQCGRCWRCDKPMEPFGDPIAREAASIEHTLGRGARNGSQLQYLALSHRRCNNEAG